MTGPIPRERVLRTVCLAAVLAAPAAGSLGLLAYGGYSLRDYTPFFNDEVLYYLQARAFAAHGFGAGYFGMEEQAAPAAFSRFGVHGPAFPVLYGGIARLSGVSYDLAAYLNVAALTLALAAYVALTRPANRTLLLLAGFFLSFWPFYYVVFSWTQDALHLAVAVLLAGLFAALLADAYPARRRALVAATLLVVCCASLLRVSWALLLPPLFALAARGRSPRIVVSAGVLGCAATLACMKAFQWLCSPYAGTDTAFLMNKLVTGEAGLSLVWSHSLANLAKFGDYFRGDSDVLSSGVVLGSLLVIVVVAVAGTALVDARKKGGTPAGRGGRWLAFVGYNQVAIAAATVLTYYVGNGGAPRVFAVHLLLGLLVALNAPLLPLRALLPAALVLNLATAVYSLDFLRDFYAAAFTNRARVEAFRGRWDGLVAFDPDGDGWSNTLLTDRLPAELVTLPPGVGVEAFFVPERLAAPVRSRYVITTPDGAGILGPGSKCLATLKDLGGEMGSYSAKQPALYLNGRPRSAGGGEVRRGQR